MKIIMAMSVGFCFGVERAYKISLDSIKKESCQMLGNLVHNEKVIEELTAKGLQFVSDLNKLKRGRVIIRAHGVGDETIKTLKAMKMEIIDATCPLVQKVQSFAQGLEKEGRKVIIIGEKSHAEIMAINGSIGNRAIIIENEKDIDNIPKGFSLGVVIQTTQELKTAEDLINLLKKRFKNVTICNTLCHAVLKRQVEVKELAKEADIVLVVGSKNSANTQTLFKVAREIQMTYLVEGPEDLKKEWFDKVNSVGITSGTSTPLWLISNVKDKVKSIIV